MSSTSIRKKANALLAGVDLDSPLTKTKLCEVLQLSSVSILTNFLLAKLNTNAEGALAKLLSIIEQAKETP